MRSALVITSAVLTVVVLECAARIVRSRVTGKGALTVDRYMEPDPVLGWSKRPHAHVVFNEPEYHTEVTINSQGLRDPERDYVPASPATLRILALGDSFVEGYTVPLAETVTQVLESRLRGRACQVEVLNGGTAGYSTDQEYLFYVKEGMRYSPKVVVLFFYFNDVLYNARSIYSSGDPKPLLRQQGDTLTLTTEPVPLQRRTSTERSARPPSVQGSALLQWISGRLRRGAPSVYNRLARLGLWPPVTHKPPPEQYEVYRRAASPEIKGAWIETGLILAALAREVEKRDAHLLIVYVPSRMEVSDQSWTATQFEYGMKEAHWDRTMVLARLKRIADPLRLRVLDLTPPLRRVERGLLGGPYFIEDGHWNRSGHSVAAAEVAEEVWSQGWLPGCLPQ